jgi:hypothetical protein
MRRKENPFTPSLSLQGRGSWDTPSREGRVKQAVFMMTISVTGRT